MHPKLTLAIVLLSFVLVDAKGGRSGERGRHGHHDGHHGGHSGGGRGGGSHSRFGGSSSSESHENGWDDGEEYTWGINVEGNTVIQEADIPVNESVVLMKSDGLRSLNISYSRTILDFSGNTSIQLVVFGFRRRSCYIISYSKTFDDVKSELAKYNNTNVNVTSSTRLKVSGAPLTVAEALELLASHPALRKACRSGIIYNTEATTDDPVDGETRLVTVLSEDRVVEMIVADTPRTTPPPPPPTRRPPFVPPFRHGGKH